MKDFDKYIEMMNSGRTIHEIYDRAKSDGFDQSERIRMLRSVFGKTIKDAHDFAFAIDNGSEYVRENVGIVSDFERVLDDELGNKWSE